jgi:exopolysaccharide biosynthesis polyprenyl glycosylphosphotransferase
VAGRADEQAAGWRPGRAVHPSGAASRRNRPAPAGAGLRPVGTRTLPGLSVLVADIGAVTAAALATGAGAAGAALGALVLVGLAASHSYRPRLCLSALDQAPRLAAAVGVPLLALAPLAPPAAVLTQAAATLALLIVGRSFAYAAVRAARRRGLLEPAVVVGTGRLAVDIAAVVDAHPEYGLAVTGFVGSPDAALPAPRFGELADLAAAVRESGARTVLVAFDLEGEEHAVGQLRALARSGVDLFVVPRFFDLGVAPRGADVDELWGVPLYHLRQAGIRPFARRAKRAFDVVVGSLLLALALPLMLLTAGAVRVTAGPGPVLFRQRRVGRDGVPIEILKFRTLPIDHVDEHWNADDTAYTRPLLRLVRRCSLDELPQLWNVVRGDMSLVGPRPERDHLVPRFSRRIGGYRDRHRMPVGLTGWAQVHGLRGETSLAERVRFDNHYIEHWSLWRDVVVLLRTCGSFFRAPNRASIPEPGLDDDA